LNNAGSFLFVTGTQLESRGKDLASTMALTLRRNAAARNNPGHGVVYSALRLGALAVKLPA
jgi:hypothetical protein